MIKAKVSRKVTMSEAPKVKNEIYISAAQNALFTFQMIEEALKICIRGSYEILVRSAPSPVVFSFEAEAITNSPLGQLIKMFSRVSANRTLIEDLKSIEKWRNFCAHRVYTHEFLKRGTSEAVSQSDIDDLQKVTAAGVKLVEQLGIEMVAIRSTHAKLHKAES